MPKKKIIKKKIVKKIIKKGAKSKKATPGISKRRTLIKTKNKIVVKTLDKSFGKPIGRVTHYFGNLKVGIIKCKKPVKIGDEIQIKGATTDFKQIISSMQYNYKEIKVTPLNKEVGIKVKKMVREGDLIFSTNYE
ncbi:MAG: hypothetical protein Q8L47_01510 [bacterium]|nr:hypothetical protein [bacterium]